MESNLFRALEFPEDSSQKARETKMEEYGS